MGRDRCLRDQIIRSAFSVPSNIAEGNERESNQDALRFLLISKGSLGELRTQLEIIHEAGCLDRPTWLELERRADEIAALLGGMIRYRRNRRPKEGS